MNSRPDLFKDITPVVLSCANIEFRFRSGVTALNGVTIDFSPGINGLIGRNGCGKSTLLQILATTLSPTKGTLTWGDVDVVRRPDTLRAVLGYLPQYFGVYRHLSAAEFLRYLGGLRGLNGRGADKRGSALLERLGLAHVRDRRLSSFSGGMLRRVGIAAALLGDPRVVLLDEPSAGLDPAERSNLIALLREQRDVTIVLSTHVYSDISNAADSIVCMEGGRIANVMAPLTGDGARREDVERFCETFVTRGRE